MWDKRPKDWDVRRLSEITKRIVRKNDGLGHPVMTISAKRGFLLQSDKFSRDMAGKSEQRYILLKSGEFAYNKGNSFAAPHGCIFSLEQASAIVPFVYYCFSISSEIDKDYALHAFQGGVLNRELARSINSGVRNDGLLNLPVKDFFRSQMAVPPLAEQRAIAAVLGAMKAAISGTELLIKAITETRRSIIDGILAEAFFRYGDICLLRLRDIAEVRTGISKSKDRTLKDPVEIPYLRVANVQDGYLNLSKIKTIDVERSQIARYRLRVGDVLFNEGGDFDKLGRGCVWNGEISDCIHQNHVFVVRCKSDIVPEFLALQAASTRGKNYFRLSSKQTTNLASINTSDLRSFPVIVPPLDFQQRAAKMVAACDKRLSQEVELLNRLRNTRDALSQELLSGRLRLPDSLIARHINTPVKAA